MILLIDHHLVLTLFPDRRTFGYGNCEHRKTRRPKPFGLRFELEVTLGLGLLVWIRLEIVLGFT